YQARTAFGSDRVSKPRLRCVTGEVRSTRTPQLARGVPATGTPSTTSARGSTTQSASRGSCLSGDEGEGGMGRPPRESLRLPGCNDGGGSAAALPIDGRAAAPGFPPSRAAGTCPRVGGGHRLDGLAGSRNEPTQSQGRRRRRLKARGPENEKRPA